MNKYDNLNSQILRMMSIFLNEYPKIITKKVIDKVKKANVDDSYAYAITFASLLDIDTFDKEGKEIFQEYFLKMFKKLSIDTYKDNDYYKNIHIPSSKEGKWTLKMDSYAPYEAFVFDDFKYYLDGRVIPQIGFFDTSFKYPAVYENDRLWMSITPNEIETMKKSIDLAKGNVLTFGLGMGYYAYMTSQKEDVARVDIVEREEEVITLFKKVILPQFPHKEKINIIHDDAFNYIETIKDKNYHIVFTDLWHDASDGVELYLKMKPFEKENPNVIFQYWIEDTIKYYLK